MRNWKDIPYATVRSDKTLLKAFYEDYETVFGKPCRSCESKLNSYYIQLTKFHIKMSESKTCRLKDGVLLFDPETHRHYNNNTITDSVAKNLLKKNALIAQRFEILPEGMTVAKVAKPTSGKSKSRSKKKVEPKIEEPTAEVETEEATEEKSE